MSASESNSPQLLHLVFGGEVEGVGSTRFRHLPAYLIFHGDYQGVAAFGNIRLKIQAHCARHVALWIKPLAGIGRGRGLRENLLAFIDDCSILEIGPFHSPLKRGPNVEYLDVLDAEQLRQRAATTRGTGERPRSPHSSRP